MQPLAAALAYIRRSDDETSCWPWTGTVLDSGYGQIRVSGQKMGAHHAAWLLAHGTIPDGMMIGHTCDNPPCCRNDDLGTYEVAGISYERRGHLWLATPAANSADMAAKGRARNRYLPA
jgi:hypothetical protein